jgi:hypothetical protein
MLIWALCSEFIADRNGKGVLMVDATKKSVHRSTCCGSLWVPVNTIVSMYLNTSHGACSSDDTLVVAFLPATLKTLGCRHEFD